MPTDLGRVDDIAIGENHLCVLRDGVAQCWGDNFFGQSIPPGNQSLSRITAGTKHTCGLDSNEGFVCWGRIDTSSLLSEEWVFDLGLEQKFNLIASALYREKREFLETQAQRVAGQNEFLQHATLLQLLPFIQQLTTPWVARFVHPHLPKLRLASVLRNEISEVRDLQKTQDVLVAALTLQADLWNSIVSLLSEPNADLVSTEILPRIVDLVTGQSIQEDDLEALLEVIDDQTMQENLERDIRLRPFSEVLRQQMEWMRL